MNLKKNISALHKSRPDTAIYFFDESRFGTHSNIGHGWFNKGERTPVKIKMGFENFYIYSAVHAADGDEFSFILPKVNTACMNIFLKQFSQQLKAKQAIIVMDRAAWHKSKDLFVPNNIEILLLPPYSPELNPVERLWNYLKSKLIKNKVYESLEQLYDAVSHFMIDLQPHTVKNICSASYLGG